MSTDLLGKDHRKARKVREDISATLCEKVQQCGVEHGLHG